MIKSTRLAPRCKPYKPHADSLSEAGNRADLRAALATRPPPKQ